MKHFEHVNAFSPADAVGLLDSHRDASCIAGGTDLLTRMKSLIVAPERLVNIKTVPGWDGITYHGKLGLRIGALATLDAVAGNETVRGRYPMLSQAISLAATRQIRNQGTLGGNLVQGSRCWYYRGQFRCWLKGGDVCYARNGENSHHAIFVGSPCHMVHPSDAAPVLLALGASVETVNPDGSRVFPLEDLYQWPRADDRRPVTLQPRGIISAVTVPPLGPDSRGFYLKAMDRKAWSFALVSAAVWISFSGNKVRDARIVLGGVAPRPYPVPHAADALKGMRLDDEIIDRTADLAVANARPLAHNEYKVILAREIVKKAVRAVGDSR